MLQRMSFSRGAAAALLGVGFVVPKVVFAQSELPLYRLSEELRIGSEASEFTALTRPADIEVDRAGNIYVTQWQKDYVAKFGPDGSPLQQLGRRGQGPGEFARPSMLGWRGDTLWVLDSGLSRISLWSRGVDFVRSETFRVPASGVWGPQVPGTLLGDGSVISFPTPTHMIANSRSEVPVPVLKYELPNLSPDTLFMIRNGKPYALVRLPNGAMVQGRHPLSHRDLVRPDPFSGGFIVVTHPPDAQNGTVNVYRIGPGGDTLGNGVLQYAERKVTDDALNAIVQEYSAPIARAHELELSSVTRAVKSQVEFPGTWPPVDKILPAANGEVWLRETPEAVDSGAVWTVLDQTLVPVHRVRVRADVELLRGHSSKVYGYYLSPADVPFVARFRLVRE